jgi:surface polysaccharide O-acyltransferase-like enzyme
MTTQTAPQITAAEDPVRTLAFTSYLRVVAIVAVVLIHVSGSTYVLKGARGSSAWWVASVLTFSTKWAVPVFVMVSGTLLLKPPANRSASVFYRRRLSRIGIPLLVWHAVYVSLVMFVISPDLRRDIVMGNVLRGEAYTALYFFWLILGLYVVTPLLWPLVESASRRQLIVIGAGLTALPALDLVTRNVIGRLRDNPMPLGEPTLFTQFVPYVGFFILGYALRSVIVRGWALAALGVGVLLLAAEITAQVTLLGRLPKPWPLYVNTFIPVNYQGWLLGLCAIGLFIWVRSATRPGTRAATPETARRARALGDLTFGVFACHLLVLFVLKHLAGMGTGEAPDTVLGVLGLNAAVVVVSFIVAKVFLSLPVLRRTM